MFQIQTITQDHDNLLMILKKKQKSSSHSLHTCTTENTIWSDIVPKSPANNPNFTTIPPKSSPGLPILLGDDRAFSKNSKYNVQCEEYFQNISHSEKHQSVPNCDALPKIFPNQQKVSYHRCPVLVTDLLLVLMTANLWIMKSSFFMKILPRLHFI